LIPFLYGPDNTLTDKNLIGFRQDHEPVCHVDRSAKQIDCHVRGMQPWPVAFTFFPGAGGKPPIRLAIKAISVLDERAADVPAGHVVSEDASGQFVVAAADKLVRIERLQPAGKQEMSGAEFIRGRSIDGAIRLG